MRFFLVLFLCICLTVSCLSPTKEGGTETREVTHELPSAETEIRSTNDTLTYTYHVVRENSPYYVLHGEDQIDTTYYSISQPVFHHTKFNRLIKPFVLIYQDSTAEEAVGSFITEYNVYREDTGSTDSKAWYRDARSSIENNTNRFFLLQTSYDEYTGGAHGQQTVLLFNVDVLNMQRIVLTDVIHEEHLPQLTQIAEKIFRKKENLSDSTSLSKEYFFDNGIFALNDNFGLTKRGLIFYYNEYEIKPYSEGSTTVQIPYTDIEHILTGTGKAYVRSMK